MKQAEKMESLERIAGKVSRETVERLLNLEEVFAKWAKTVNLVAPSTLPDAWNRHFLDSAQLWGLRGDTRCWLDLGSGSGFPGLVLAALSGDEDLSTTLVESNTKKSAYLRQAVIAGNLKATVLNQRVEELAPMSFQESGVTVTARAFAPLSRILKWTNGLGAPTTRALLHKGRGFQAEVTEARGSWEFDLIEHPSLVDSEGVILDITAVKRL